MSNVTVFPSFWEGASVASVDSETETLEIELTADPLQVPRCGGLRRLRPSVPEYRTWLIRDLLMLGHPVLLWVHLRHLACSSCDRRAEWVSWLERQPRLTRRPPYGRDVWSALEHYALARTTRP